MPISVWNYLVELDAERDDILAAVEKVLNSGSLILGDSVRGFEQAFAQYCGVAHGVGVGNGTDAIFLALKALDVNAGDEVITVANTAVPTVSAIVAAGAVPVFVDILPDTYLMDVSAIEAAITARTRVIMPVHLYGQCVDMHAVIGVARRHGLRVVEDCAQAHGAEQNGRRAGAFGDLATFSFYPTKPLGGFGDGGMVITGDAQLCDRLRRLRFYGMEDKYVAVEHGYNSRLDELQAEILLRKLSRLDGYIERRNELASGYEVGLQGGGILPPVLAAGNRHVYYVYTARHARRDDILEQMKQKDIHLGVSYRWPIHTMPAYTALGYVPGDLPETERAADEIFSLPMYPSLTDQQQAVVLDALQACVGD